jgi:hypothetical protein
MQYTNLFLETSIYQCIFLETSVLYTIYQCIFRNIRAIHDLTMYFPKFQQISKISKIRNNRIIAYHFGQYMDL